MATTNNTNNDPTILVTVARKGDGVDIEGTVANARAEATAYAAIDKEATKAVIEVTNKILTNPKHAKMTSITPGVLAKMALGLMGEVPTDKLCAEAEVRVKSYMQAQPTKFLFIERGRNAGFHFVERLSATAEGKEQLVKLTKEKAASDAKRAAEVAAAAAAAATPQADAAQ